MSVTSTMPLIAPKHFSAYTQDEYYAYVQSMWAMRIKKGSAKPTSGVVGLTISRTKKGALSLRRTKARTFEYVTTDELTRLATFSKASQAEVWNLFKDKKYIIAKDRMEAEKLYGEIKEIPF